MTYLNCSAQPLETLNKRRTKMAKQKIDRNSEDFQAVTDAYAHRCLESIKDDLDALDHARECTEEGCKRGSETKRFKRDDGTFGKRCLHETPEAWHDEDAARERIEEAPYGVQVRSDWHTPGEPSSENSGEYIITLGGGGPASRIIGEFENGEPFSAHFEYQDWYKPWTQANLTGKEEDTLLRFAQCMYFGD